MALGTFACAFVPAIAALLMQCARCRDGNCDRKVLRGASFRSPNA